MSACLFVFYVFWAESTKRLLGALGPFRQDLGFVVLGRVHGPLVPFLVSKCSLSSEGARSRLQCKDSLMDRDSFMDCQGAQSQKEGQQD